MAQKFELPLKKSLSVQKDKILIIGSIAYDSVMQYEGLFENVILPKNFSIALTTCDKKIFFGGCGGNIAYNLSLFSEKPVLLTSAGKDFQMYQQWLKKRKIDISGIYISSKEYTASATIVTDQQQNQITIFDPGAMTEKTKLKIKNLFPGNISWAIISPDNPRHMISSAEECFQFNIPYIFDPGQAIAHLPFESLIQSIQRSHVLIVNEYESQLLLEKLHCSPQKLHSMVPVFIETLGAKGCKVVSNQGNFIIPAIKPHKIFDPTGCGDAFRAGVLVGLKNNFSLQKSCQIGTLLATYKLEHSGTQEHVFTFSAFKKRYIQCFGEW